MVHEAARFFFGGPDCFGHIALPQLLCYNPHRFKENFHCAAERGGQCESSKGNDRT